MSLLLLVTVILSLTLATMIETDDDTMDLEIPKDGISSLRQMLIQNMLRQKDFEDSVHRVREAGPKRAHARRFDQMPPGFVGVRGRKSEKSKIKEPVPGFLGVRGKKSYHFSLLSNEGLRSTIASNRRADSIDKCIRNELAKYKNVE